MGLDDELLVRAGEPDPARRTARILALFQAHGFRVRMRVNEAGAFRISEPQDGGLRQLLEGNGPQRLMVMVWPDWQSRHDLPDPDEPLE